MMRRRQGTYMCVCVGGGGVMRGRQCWRINWLCMLVNALRLLLSEERSVYRSGVKSRPTIRVVSPLYSERTKPCPIANRKALTSWSNRSNQFLTPAGFHDSKCRTSGTQLAAKTEHSECWFRRCTDIRNTIHVVNQRFIICYLGKIFSYRNLFVIALVKNVTRFGVGRLRMLYKTNICY